MNELIRVTINEQGSKTVSARALYQFLDVKSRFNDWITNRIKKYGFIENQDFITFTKNLVNGGIEKDYVLTIDTAKELSMVEGNEKGKQARQYFIECEKKFNKPKTQIELIIESAIFLQQQEQRLSIVEAKLAQLEGIRVLATSELNHIERSTDLVPEIGIRLKVNQIIRSYSEKTGISYNVIWNLMYSKLLYAYHFNVNAYKKLHDKESKLDIIERENQMDNLFAIVSKELV